jgi:mxaL protein
VNGPDPTSSNTPSAEPPPPSATEATSAGPPPAPAGPSPAPAGRQRSTPSAGRSALRGARAVLDADGRAILLALVLLLIALFLRPIPLKHDTYESLVIFDITQSMDVEDYEQGTTPISRLKFAREAARRALRELPCGSKVGWGAFAGYRTLILLAPVEVCENYGDLLTSLAKVDGGMRWENASEITKGVYWSMRAAKDLGTNPNVIFVTDGQEAPPLDPTNILPMFEDLKAGQVRGYLVGAGGYVPRPIPKTDEDGNRIGFWRSDEVMQPGDIIQDSKVRGLEHLSSLREPHLQEVAHQVGFGYARLTSLESIARVMLDKRFARRDKALTDLYWIPALLALMLLAARFSPIALRRRSSTVVASQHR